jgi:pimeloyl-ACP methyl ester carboxylesterase
VEFHPLAGEGQQHVVSQAGEGPDVVLLHGFPDTPYSWEDLASTLVSAGFRVTVPWLRGYHPDTIVPGRRYDPETLSHDAISLLDAIDAPRAVLVGHDWGAMITYATAAMAPERVRGIVTIAIPHATVIRPTPQVMWAVRHVFELKLPGAAGRLRRNDFAHLEQLYKRWAPGWTGPEREDSVRRAKLALTPQATLNGALSYYRDFPLKGDPLLKRIPAMPGLIIGTSHRPGQRDLFERTAELLAPPSRAVIVEGAGHWPHRENAAAVTPELVRFLSELDA